MLSTHCPGTRSWPGSIARKSTPPPELSYISQEIDMIGINNRNLGTFVTDVENSFRLAGQLSQAVVHSHEPSAKTRKPPLLVSESGITHPETIRKLRMTGFRGFLMGETFMRTEHPENTLKEFISQILSNTRILRTSVVETKKE